MKKTTAARIAAQRSFDNKRDNISSALSEKRKSNLHVYRAQDVKALATKRSDCHEPTHQILEKTDSRFHSSF